MASRFDEILNDCTERLLRGESVEQCLARYPEEATGLEPLLRVALAAGKASSAVEPRPEFKARVRHEVQSQIRSRRGKAEPKRIPALHWIPRWAAVAACVALVFVFAAGGTVAASTGTVPGDTLYPVKTAAEQVQMKLTFSEAGKARLEAKFAKRRVWEMAQLAKRGRTEHLEKLSKEFESHLGKFEQLAFSINEANPEDEGKIAALGEMLDRNMARDLAVLDEAEVEAPEAARPVLAVARFRLMQGYDEAIDALDELQSSQGGSADVSGEGDGGGQEPGSGSGDSPSSGDDGSADPAQGGETGEGGQNPTGPTSSLQLGTQYTRAS